MQTFRDLIARWPTVADFARDIEVGYQAARKMYDRNSIRNVYWQTIITAAKARGIRLTLGEMVEMAANSGNEQRKDARTPRCANAA